MWIMLDDFSSGVFTVADLGFIVCVCVCVRSIIGMMSYLYRAVGTPYSLRADQAICQSIIYALLEHSN